MIITLKSRKIRVMGGRRSLYEQIFGIVKYFGYIVNISAYAGRFELTRSRQPAENTKNH